MKNRGLISMLLILALASVNASAQDSLAVNLPVAGNGGPSVDRLLYWADSLRNEYSFEASSRCYQEALDKVRDSVRRSEILAQKVLSDNGVSMLGYVSEPVVVARHRFALEDFFLYYPLEDRSWKPVPNKLDTDKKPAFSKAVYMPSDCSELFYSSVDESGSRNICHTFRKDSLWTAPEYVNESMTSTGDEIYPMLSPDGKSLYFASSGLYGIGGYDLYVSNWNDTANDWDEPVNMGFPYSSPGDDFLFINTEDGKYSIFASNRDCSRDSVDVYVLEFDNMPVRKEVRDLERIREIASLRPVEDPRRMDNGSSAAQDMPDNADTRRYMDKMSQVRALKDSITIYGRSLDEQRTRFATSEDENERTSLTASILRGEQRLPVLQDSLQAAVAQLQQIEMDFLFKGVVIDPEKVLAKADREVVGASSAYTFTRMTPGRLPEMEIEKPVVEFDYTFMVLPEGRFAENSKLPDGVVYQIQLFTMNAPATVKQIKGLSPVFESRTESGRFIYRAGLFTRHSDVLSQLNRVKKLGFRDAFIAAFVDGKSVKVSVAREKEKTMVKALYQVNINMGGEDLPREVVKLIKDFCNKDVMKVNSDGVVLYVVAPFTDMLEAEELEALIKDSGTPNVSVTRINSESGK